jgi:tRNA pseudouridine38-40 synthase
MSKPAGVSGGFSRFRIDLSYDGTDFAGWAKQPTLRTVQGDLLKALIKIFGEDENDFGMRVAGRTDAGVHALKQVCHFDVTPEQLKRAGRSGITAKRLQSLLTPEIVIADVKPVSTDFDARFSAIGRSYRYLIADRSTPKSPLTGRYVLWVLNDLDTDLMQQAANQLVGLHDFGAFCKPKAGATTIRELRKLKVTRSENHIEVQLQADAFCRNQVRAIVGSLIAVGGKKLSIPALVTILKGKTRVSAFKVVAAHGLALTAVEYPSDDQLAIQAEKARRRRTAEEISV